MKDDVLDDGRGDFWLMLAYGIMGLGAAAGAITHFWRFSKYRALCKEKRARYR